MSGDSGREKAPPCTTPPEAHSSHKDSDLPVAAGPAPEAHVKPTTSTRKRHYDKPEIDSPAKVATEGVLDLSVKKSSSPKNTKVSREQNRRTGGRQGGSAVAQLASPQRSASVSSHSSSTAALHSPRMRELERGEIADVRSGSASALEQQRAADVAHAQAELLASALQQNLTDSYYASMLGSLAFMPPMFDPASALLVPPTDASSGTAGRGRSRGRGGGGRKSRAQQQQHVVNGAASPSPPLRSSRGRPRGSGTPRGSGSRGASVRSSRGRGRAKNVESRSLAELAMEVSPL